MRNHQERINLQGMNHCHSEEFTVIAKFYKRLEKARLEDSTALNIAPQDQKIYHSKQDLKCRVQG